MNPLEELLGLGLQSTELRMSQMLLRALIVSVGMLGMIRLAGRRFLVRRSPFDVLLGFIIASMLSRAINGSAALGDTLGTGFMLAALYRFVAWCAFKSHTFGRWIKGSSEKLIENGVAMEEVLNRHQISQHDLMEDLRLNAALDDIAEVKQAYMERNGKISVQRRPQVFTIGVEAGVQTVRIQVET